MKKKSLWILLGILILLIGVYFGIGHWQKVQKEKDDLEKEKSKITLVKGNDWKKLSYTKDGSELRFEKKEDTWYVEGDDKTKLTQSYVTAIAEAFSDLQAVRELKGGDELSDYGLDNPTYTVTLTDKDGKQIVCYIGNEAGENYYFTMGEKKKVYLIPGEVVQTLQYDLEQMKSTEE